MALGVASRWIDTAAWAPAWIGLVLSPWLVAPWLGGAWTSWPDGNLAWGAAAGFLMLAATVATYLAMAGPESAPILAGLPILVVSAGPIYGAAGAALHGGRRGRLLAASVLGAALIADGLLLQLGARSPLERAVFAVESAGGVVLATWMAGSRAGLLAIAAGVILLGVELAMLATIGPSLP